MLHRLKFKLALFTTLLAPAEYNLVLANFTPPPPIISNYYNKSYGRYTELHEINATHGFNVAGRRIEVGAGGVNVNYYGGRRGYIAGNGAITSKYSILDIRLSPMPVGLEIHSSICDHDDHRVGVRLTSRESAHLFIVGDKDNTFTGDMMIDGFHFLSLNKTNNAVSIPKGLVLRNRAQLHLGYGNQLGRQATVKLHDASFNFWSMDGNYMKEKFNQLVVTGQSELNFHGGGHYAKGAIYLDDLLVSDWSSLLIKGWRKNGDHLLLVRKDSKNLWESLNRIKFEGSADWEWKAGVEDYSWDYWQIVPGFPEPTTYGAALSVAALGLWAWRRKRRVPTCGCS